MDTMMLAEQAEATSAALGKPLVFTQNATSAERLAAKMTENSFRYAEKKLTGSNE
jgi:hypothetical protein